jgi:hypothetical protein
VEKANPAPLNDSSRDKDTVNENAGDTIPFLDRWGLQEKAVVPNVLDQTNRVDTAGGGKCQLLNIISYSIYPVLSRKIRT